MKTAVSIPDDLFASADRLAEELDVSRSALYARALAEYVAKHDSAEITARLNEVYASYGEDEGLDPALRRAQARALEGLDDPRPEGDAEEAC